MIGAYLFDIKLNLIDSISPDVMSENTQTMELGGQINGTIRFEYKESSENAEYFGVKEENNFWLYKIRNKKKESGTLEFNGIHIFFNDSKGRVVRKNIIENESAALAVEKILLGTGWIVGNNSTTRIASMELENVSALNAFYDIVKTWNIEFIPRITFSKGKIIKKQVDLYDKISKNYGRCFSYGNNLLSVVAESNTDDLFTAFIGIGKTLELQDENGRRIKNETNEKLKFVVDGKDYVEIKEATAAFGYPDGTPKIGVVEFSDIDDKDKLYKATLDYAKENCRPKLQMKASGISENVELGETVGIRRKDLNINYLTRVFKIKKDFLKNSVVEFEFGDKVVNTQADRIKAERAEKEEQNKTWNNYINSLRDEINDSYFNDGAYNYDLKIGNPYKLPAGYYSFDRPIDKNPTKVIYMGAGKLLIANSKKSDGSWNWRTAATADGLVADEIVGTLGEFAKINASQINVNNEFFNTDIGKSINGKLEIIDNKIVDENGKIREDLKLVDNKIVDETGKIRNDLKVVDGKIVDLNNKAVLKDTLYNNVKITPSKGIQVLDSNNRERVQLGNWSSGRYGLKLTSENGNRTILDDRGILQSWQDSQTDNVDESYPLNLHIYIPDETSRIYKADLMIYTDRFRAYSRATEYKQSESSTTDSGGGDWSSTDSGNGGYATTGVETYQSGRGHNHGIPNNTGLVDKSGRQYWFSESGDHTHTVNLPSHTHSVKIPSHSHGVTIPGHQHDIVYGIYTSAGRTEYTVRVNGNYVGRVGYTTSKMDVSSYLKKGQWNDISVKATGLGRVSASLFIQALLNYGGY